MKNTESCVWAIKYSDHFIRHGELNNSITWFKYNLLRNYILIFFVCWRRKKKKICHQLFFGVCCVNACVYSMFFFHFRERKFREFGKNTPSLSIQRSSFQLWSLSLSLSYSHSRLVSFKSIIIALTLWHSKHTLTTLQNWM